MNKFRELDEKLYSSDIKYNLCSKLVLLCLWVMCYVRNVIRFKNFYVRVFMFMLAFELVYKVVSYSINVFLVSMDYTKNVVIILMGNSTTII